MIVNRLSIQYISDLKDYYVQKANEALESIESFNKIINFENFRNDCISDGHLIKRVTRIANSPGIIDDFFDKFNRLQEVVDAASLAIQIENEKINYSGTREERLDILKCIADSLYQTLLQRNIGEDKLK